MTFKVQKLSHYNQMTKQLLYHESWLIKNIKSQNCQNREQYHLLDLLGYSQYSQPLEWMLLKVHHQCHPPLMWKWFQLDPIEVSLLTLHDPSRLRDLQQMCCSSSCTSTKGCTARRPNHSIFVVGNDFSSSCFSLKRKHHSLAQHPNVVHVWFMDQIANLCNGNQIGSTNKYDKIEEITEI